MKKQVLTLAVVLFAFAMLLPVGTFAAQDEQGERPQGPPPEAFEVCKDKSAGDEVVINTPQGEMKGVCQDMQGQLVAVPEGGPQGGPPQQ
jgi:hypothetical protein